MITISRILGVGVIFWLTPYTTNLTAIWVIIIYTIIALTDILDGWVARKYNLVSDLGKILDPLADKILVLVFLPLLAMHAINPFPVFIILSREFAIMALRVFAAKHGIIIDANMWGKIKTGITLPVCGLLMVRIPVDIVAVPAYLNPISSVFNWVHAWPSWAYESLIWLMVVATLFSFLDYLFKFLWNRALQKHNNDKVKVKKTFTVLIPNSITVINLLCGLGAIHQAFQHNYINTAALILAGVLFDALDGKLARKLDVFSKFGANLDSKADFVTFGIAPGILIYNYLVNSTLPYSTPIALTLGITFYLSVHYRLKRFNQGGHSDYFDGYPSPGGATIVSLVVASQYISSPLTVAITASLMCILMISKFPYPHNRISDQIIGFKYIRRPTLVFWLITLLYFMGTPFPSTWYIPEILLILNSIYMISPILPQSKSFE
jgi:CDP-diacylglycerol--glycerol-3-phosphate 3-phosphatidyltransferase/CDP-diacylglycerol--serine O-phosphatidyltransferase